MKNAVIFLLISLFLSGCIGKDWEKVVQEKDNTIRRLTIEKQKAERDAKELNQENTDLLVNNAALQQVLIDNHLVHRDSLVEANKKLVESKLIHEQSLVTVQGDYRFDTTALNIIPVMAGYYKVLGKLEILQVVGQN